MNLKTALRFTIIFKIKHLILGVLILIKMYLLHMMVKKEFLLSKNIFHFFKLNTINMMTIKEYIEFGMLSDKMGLGEKLYFLTRNKQLQFHSTVYNEYYDILLNNKKIFKDLCKSYNIRTPLSLAVVNIHGMHKSVLSEIIINTLDSIQNYPVIIKPIYGLCGKCIFKIDSYNKSSKFLKIAGTETCVGSLVDNLVKNVFKEYLVEEFINQHDVLQEIYPIAANTVRVQTFYHNDNFHIAGALLKYGISGRCVDNIGENQLYSLINVETGMTCKTLKIKGHTISDALRINFIETLEYHPDTNKRISGILVPYWAEIIDVAKCCCANFSMFRSIGWDIAIGKDGPIVIEGNADWTAKYQQIAGGGIYKEEIKYIIDSELQINNRYRIS